MNVISDCSYWVTPRPAALTLALVTGDYLYSVLISHLLSWGTKTKSYICTRTLGFIASCVTTHRYVTLVKLLPEAGKCDHGPRFYILHTRYTTHCAPAVICSLQEPENNRVSTRWHDDLITGTWIEAPWHRDFTDAAGKLFLCLSYVQCQVLLKFGSISQSVPLGPACQPDEYWNELAAKVWQFTDITQLSRTMAECPWVSHWP